METATSGNPAAFELDVGFHVSGQGQKKLPNQSTAKQKSLLVGLLVLRVQGRHGYEFSLAGLDRVYIDQHVGIYVPILLGVPH